MNKDLINRRFIGAVDYLLSNNLIENKGALSSSLGIKPSKFSEILNYRMNAGTDSIAMLCDLYDIDANWLLTGRGSMLREDQPSVQAMVAPVTTDSGEASVYYKMYREERAKSDAQAEEIGSLKNQVKTLEKQLEDLGFGKPKLPKASDVSPRTHKKGVAGLENAQFADQSGFVEVK